MYSSEKELLNKITETNQRIFTAFGVQLAEIAGLINMLYAAEMVRQSRELGIPIEQLNSELLGILGTAQETALEHSLELQRQVAAVLRKPKTEDP
jgi:hypothetical protein